MSWDKFAALLFADLTERDMRTLRTVGWRIVTVVFVCYAMGWLGFLGLTGFVSVAQADQKIAQQLLPLTAQVAQLTAAIQKQGTAAMEQTIHTLRGQILDAMVKLCHAPKPETKQLYRKQIDEAQDRYRDIMGQYAPEPTCAEL